MNNFPRVEVDFVISGQFNVQQFAKEIGIYPFKKRELDDWPEAIKNNPNLPDLSGEQFNEKADWGVGQRHGGLFSRNCCPGNRAYGKAQPKLPEYFQERTVQSSRSAFSQKVQ